MGKFKQLKKECSKLIVYQHFGNQFYSVKGGRLKYTVKVTVKLIDPKSLKCMCSKPRMDLYTLSLNCGSVLVHSKNL